MPASERLVAETADTYPDTTRGERARRADRHTGLDVVLVCALVVGPVAVLISRLDPGVATTAAIMPLLGVLAASVALGDLVDDSEATVARRRLAIVVLAIAIASIFLIVRTT